MRIDRIVARAFGPFRGESLELAPGMTVVAGPNEAGKSTFHAAVRLALTGLRRGKGPGTAAERQLADRHRPWDQPDQWAVEARITLDDGRTIDITQDLAGKVACRAVDVALGRDVSDEILDGTPDASRWLGLDRESFAATVSVGQAQILAVAEAADQLQEHMQRAAATRGTDATAAEAIARLEEFRRDAVGADKAAAKGPLRTARNAVAAAEARLAEAQQAHAAYLDEGAELEAAERAVDGTRRRLAAAEASALRRDADAAASRLARAEDLAARHPTAPPPIAGRDEEANLAAAAVEAWASRPAPPSLQGRSAEELAALLEALPPRPDGDLAADPRAAEALRALDLAEEAMRLHGEPPAPPEGPGPLADTAQLRDLARRLRSPQLPQAASLERQLAAARMELERAPGDNRLPLLLAAALAIAGLVAIAAGAPVPGGALLLVAGGAAGWAWLGGGVRRRVAGRVRNLEAALAPFREAVEAAAQERRTAAEAATRLGLPADPARLDLLADAAAQGARDRQLADDWHARRAALEARRYSAAELLLRVLRDRGEPSSDDPRPAYEAYVAACASRAAQAQLASQAEALQRELASRRAAETARAGALEAGAEAERRLREAAAALGIEPTPDPDGLAASLRAWLMDRSADLERGQQALLEWQELQVLLGGRSLDELRADVARRVRHAAATASEDRLRPPDSDAGGRPLGDRIAALREELSRCQSRADGLRGSQAARGEGLPDVAEAEETLGAARAELARVGELARTLDEALRLLRAAQEQVHRSLAPLLGEAIGRWLPAVSDGAYAEASVDPADLSIRVKELATGHWRTARLLSEGTREQIYLLLRVAMAQQLVTPGTSSPLILDEVTAQSDTTRRRQLLDVLHHVSAEQQVILFTHDDEVVAWAEQALAPGRDALVRLPSPWRSDAAPRDGDGPLAAAIPVAGPAALPASVSD